MNKFSFDIFCYSFFRLFLAFFLFISWFSLVNAWGAELEKTSNAIEKFQEIQKEFLFKQDLWLSKEDLEILDYIKRADAFKILSERLNNHKKELEEKGQVISRKVVNLENTIETMDSSLKEKEAEILETNIEIVSLLKEKIDLEENIEKLENKIKNDKEILNEYALYVYKEWAILHKDWEIDNLKTIIFNSWDIWEVFSEYTFSLMLQTAGQNLLESYRWNITSMFEEKAKLAKKTSETKKKKRRLNVLKKVLEDKKKTREKLLEITKWREYLFQKYMAEQKEAQRDQKLVYFKSKIEYNSLKENLQKKYNCNDLFTENFIPSTKKCEAIKEMLDNEEKLIWATPDKILLDWPVVPEKWLSAYFNDPDYKKRFKVNHNAIDIVVAQWSDIKSPLDWYVLYVNEPKQWNYWYVAIKHFSWFITVYWHISESLVSQYDFVEKWEIFAKTWWEPWTIWAWLFTTWAHLHFEILKNWDYVDPLNYLDLTWIRPNDLPLDRYLYKFYDDYKYKYWTDKWFNKDVLVFRVEWDDEIERQKSLLSKYATSSFNNWNMWVEEAEEWNIDATFVMCVWLAESGLWRNLKTAYNVWNIWNTDSGSTYTFPDARSWIYWMIKTLNNKYLWKHNQISQLSRYWNKDGHIYASAPYYWHNNVVKCMSAIKWEYIKDNYNFRTK